MKAKQVLVKITRQVFQVAVVFTLFIVQTSQVFATNDPLGVISNLSNFVFGLIRAVGMIILGFGVVQIRNVIKIT